MTGFAQVQGDTCGILWSWEIKSGNSRSLDLRLRLAAGYDALEPELRNRLAQRFRRGAFFAALAVTRTRPMPLRINREALSQLMALISELSREINAAPPRLDGLLALRGIVDTVENEPAATLEARRRALLDGWETATQQLAAARMQEGARVGAALRAQLGEMRTLVGGAKTCVATQPAAIRARLEIALANLDRSVPALSEERLAQEVALLATRADIREEVDRLHAHLDQAEDLLVGGEAVGRRLDFLCQELNREANTLCSKSGDIDLTRIGLALKATVEQFREQAQNIE